MINIRQAPLGAGKGWITQSFKLFRERKLFWYSYIIFMILSGLILSALNGTILIVGQAIGAIFFGYLGIGMLVALKKQLAGQAPQFEDVMEPFTKKGKELLPILCFLAIIQIIMSVSTANLNPEAFNPEDPLSNIGFSLLSILISTTVGMFTIYSIPNVYFYEVGILDSLTSSFKICLRNLLPLTVYYLMLVPVCILSAITIVGIFIILPIVFISSLIMYFEFTGDGLLVGTKTDQ